MDLALLSVVVHDEASSVVVRSTTAFLDLDLKDTLPVDESREIESL